MMNKLQSEKRADCPEPEFSKKNLSRREFLKTAAGLSLAAAGGPLLAACASTPMPTPEVAEKVATVPAAGGLSYEGELVLWDWQHPPRIALTERMIQQWEALHPGIKIRYNPLPWGDISTKMLPAVMAGTGPDFSNLHEVWSFDFLRAGALEPYPEELFPPDFWKDHFTTPWFRQKDGKIYHAAYALYTGMTYWNEELWAEAGLSEKDLPKTWDDAIRVAKELTKTDNSGAITQAGIDNNGFWYTMIWFWDMFYQLGGHQYDQKQTITMLRDSPEARQALQFIKDHYSVHNVSSPDFMNAIDALGQGKSAMMFGKGYIHGAVTTTYPEMKDKLRIAPLPTWTGKNAPIAGFTFPEGSYAVFKTTSDEKKEACWSFIQYILANDDRFVEWALMYTSPPDRKDLLKDPRVLADPLVAPQVDVLPYLLYPGERPAESEKFYSALLDEVFLQGRPIEDALVTFADGVDGALKAAGYPERYSREYMYTPPTS